MTNASRLQGENECQYKKNEQEYMWHFLNKTCKN